MFDWIGNIFNNLFGKKKEEEKKPAPVSNQQNQTPQINLSPTPTNTGAGAWSAVPKPQQQPETPKLQTPNVSMNAADTNKSVLPTTQPTQQPNQPANIGYRKVQRADKGFDFYNGDQKINVDDYVKGTGANKTLMLTDMANQGDKVSQDYLKKTIDNSPHFSQQFQLGYKEVTKPINNKIDEYNKWIDSGDKEEGFQWNDLGDYGRFAAKLPSGILQGLVEAPLKINRALTGENVKDDGTIEKLDDWQRTGTLADGVIDVAGLPFGGSGTLLKSFGKQGAKQAVEQVGKQTTKNAVKTALKDGLKKAGEEGLEEFVQAGAGDLADDGKLNTNFGNYLEAGALGALGGGMMHGFGKGIQHGRSAVSNAINQHAQNRNSSNVNPAFNPNTNQDQTLASTVANQNQAQSGANLDTTERTAPERVESRVTERDPDLPDVTSIEPSNRYETRAAIENGVVTPRTKFLSVAEKVETALNSSIPAKYGLTTSTAQNTPATLNQDQATAQSAPQSVQGVEQPQAQPVQAGVQNTTQGYQNNVSPVYNQQAQFTQDAPAAQSIQPANLDIGNQDLRMTPALEAAYRAGTTPGTATRADMLAVQRANNQLFGMDAPNVEFADNLRTSTGEPAMGETIDTPNGPSKIRIARDQGNVEATYFHEAVHKALNDFMTSQERTDIMMSYAADNRVDPSMTETQVEELVAEDFIQYVAARNNEKFAKPRITDQIKAVFEKVLRRIQHIVAQATHQGTITPEYQQFYNDLYSGKYADEQVIDKSIRDGATPEQLQLQDHRTNLQRAWDNTLDPQTRRAISQQIAQVNEEIRGLMRQESKAYRIDPDTGVVEIDNNILNGVPKSQHAKVIRKYLQDNLQGKSYDLNYGADGEARVNSKTTRKFVDPDRDLAMRGQLVGDLPDILKVSKRIGSARDKKAHSFAKQGFEYRTATVKVGDSYYDVRINIGTGKNGKLLYTINGIKESSQNGLNRPFRGELSNRSISNFPQNVNRNTDTDSRYRLKTPRVSRAELDSVNADLAPYGLSATKADYNAALETVAYQSDPELFETYNTTKEVLDGILENYHNVKIRPQDAEHLYGKTWREIVPLAYVRKDALPLDILAAEAGYDGRVEEFTDIIMKPIELHKQIRAMEEKIRGLYANENIRQQAIAVAQNDVYDHASNEVGDKELERRQEAWEVKNNNTIQEMKQTGRELSKQQQEQQEPEASARDNQAAAEAEQRAVQEYEGRQFNNVPLQGNNAYTKGNLYNQTRLSPRDETTPVVRDGLYEYRQHTKRNKDGKHFISFERRYIGDGASGEWEPYSRALYIWKTQTNKIDKANNQQIVQEALRAAKEDGQVEDFVAYTDPKTGSTVVQKLQGDVTIDGGFVRDPRTGEIIGNHIQATPFGIVNQVNGKYDVMDNDLLAGAKKQNIFSKPKVWHNFIRTMEKTAANSQAVQKFKDFYYSKTASFNKYAKEVRQLLDEHKVIARDTERARPRMTRSKEFWDDIGRLTENTLPLHGKTDKYAAFEAKYGERATEAAKKYVEWTRNNYDSLISTLNEVRRRLGKDEIEYRKDYLPHMDKKGNLFGVKPSDISTNLRGDMEAVGRGEIPARLAGISESTKPTKKFNPHEMRRYSKNQDYELNPRKVFENYADLMLYNIHMEPVIAYGRSLEAAMRALDQTKVFKDPDSLLSTENREVNSRQTMAITEFTNELAGKTNKFDRPFVDEVTTGMKILRKLENINGANKIMGNLSSVLAQTLNLPETIRQNGLKSTGRSILKAFDRDVKEAMKQSNFLGERYTDTRGKFTKTKWQKFSEGVSKFTLMDLIERKFIELNWGANYIRLRKEGLTGFELMKQTDMACERSVGGRGLGAMPLAYKSTLGKIFLQFTYETNEVAINKAEHRKRILKDLKSGNLKAASGGVVRSAESFVTILALNSLIKGITGMAPLPDVPGAITDIIKGFQDDDDDDDEKRNPWVNATTRTIEEVAKGNPLLSATLNAIPKTERKKLFGSDSDYGRFDGATGVAQTGTNALMALFNAASGNWDDAATNIGGVLPMGSQARKTVTAHDILQKGYYEDKQGNRTDVDTGPLNWMRGLMFGKNAIMPRDENVVNETSTREAESDGFSINDLDAKTAKYTKKAIRNGNLKIEDGVALTKDGEIKRSLHKQLAKAQGESDSAYKNYLLGYGLEEGTDFDPKKDAKSKSTGDETLDKMLDSKKKASSSSKATNAINMFLNKDKLKELPDWVKKRYYKESGYSEGDIKYGALASFSTDVKMDNFYRPLAEEKDHGTLLNTLRDHRKKSIYKNGYLAASNAVISQLQKEGYLSKDEAKALKALKIERDGKEVVTQTGSGNGRGGRGRNGITSADISSFMKTIKNTGAVDINSLIKKYSGTSLSHGSVTSRMPNMRKMSSSRGNAKKSKSSLELRRL